MKQLEEILSNIRASIDTYEGMFLEDYKKLSEILRILTANLFYLESHRINAYKKWHDVYFNCKETTNAAKERIADKKVQELYMIRRTMHAAYKIVDGLRSQISIYKKEK